MYIQYLSFLLCEKNSGFFPRFAVIYHMCQTCGLPTTGFNWIRVVPFSLLSHHCIIKSWQWWMRKNILLLLRHRGQDDLFLSLNFVIVKYHFAIVVTLSNKYTNFVLIRVTLSKTAGYKGNKWMGCKLTQRWRWKTDFGCWWERSSKEDNKCHRRELEGLLKWYPWTD